MIVAGGEEYLIEPLVSPDNQTRMEKGERAEGRPHVVYKRSSLRHQYKGQSCGVIGERRDILVVLVAALYSRSEEGNIHQSADEDCGCVNVPSRDWA